MDPRRVIFLLLKIFIVYISFGCDTCLGAAPSIFTSDEKKCIVSGFGAYEVKSADTDVPSAGLASSRRHPGYMYAVNDDGASTTVTVIDTDDGTTAGTISVTGATNVDWEDVTVGACQSDSTKSCLYILDAGNMADNPANCIYVIEEPAVITGDQTLGVDQKIDFSGWGPDGVGCCTETLFIQPDGSLYFFSREFRGEGIGLYKLVNDGGWMAVKQYSTTLPSAHTGPDAAALSPDGTELIVLFHDVVYHLCVKDGDVAGALQSVTALPYTPHPCGTSIAWAPGGRGFFTSTDGAITPLLYSDRWANEMCGAPVPSSPVFSFGQTVGAAVDPALEAEVSGLSYSMDHPNFMYVVSDSESWDTVINVIQASNGEHVSTITLTGVTNTDWEDIEVGPLTPGGPNHIYILDGGGENGGPARTIYTLPEPTNLLMDQTISANIQTIMYPSTVGESHGISVTKDGRMYIVDYQSMYMGTVTKYELVDNGGAERDAVVAGTFPLLSTTPGPEDLAIAPDNSYILVKNLDTVYVFPVVNEDYATTLANPQPYRAAYTPEDRGLSIAICPHSDSFHTINSKSPFNLKGYAMIPNCMTMTADCTAKW